MALKIYLAGAIRDFNMGDIDWREKVIDKLSGEADFLNPLAGKTFNSESRKWLLNGIPSTAKTIVQQDFWCVDHADIVIFNFSGLVEKYPNIGTLCEFGRSTARPLLRYIILEQGYTGHENSKMYGLHPFIAENAAAIFETVDSCIAFLEKQLPMLSGKAPWFKGVVNG